MISDSQRVTGLENSNAEQRIAKRVESMVKSKLTDKSGLFDSEGRQVQVKVMTFSLDDQDVTDALGDSKADGLSSEESQHIQDMIYNLMVIEFIVLYVFMG